MTKNEDTNQEKWTVCYFSRQHLVVQSKAFSSSK